MTKCNNQIVHLFFALDKSGYPQRDAHNICADPKKVQTIRTPWKAHVAFSHMSAHVLLNLLKELGKRDKMRGLQSISSLFRNEFNKFNNTRARMLDSIYHMTITLKPDFWRKKNVIILSLCTQRCYGRHSGLLILLHVVISLPDATSYDKLYLID